jgi:ribosomal protein S18 acetylase RimI-like enzyme
MAHLNNDSSSTLVSLAKMAPSFWLDKTTASSSREEEWILNPPFPTTRTFVARSFVGNGTVAGEPMFDWLLQHISGATLSQREDLVRFVMTAYVAETIRKGGIVFASRRPNTDANNGTTHRPSLLTSLAIVREFDAQRESSWWVKIMDAIHDTIMAFRLVCTDGMPAIFTDPKFKQSSQIAKQVGNDMMKNLKASHVSLMPDKHWYVAVVGTEPDVQGTGQGSALMKRITQMADRANADCYLEANGPDNKTFYEKFGFHTQGSYELKNAWNPDNISGDTMTTNYMVRRCTKSG